MADYDQLRVLDALFESFCGILNLKERICFLSAARGLSRLHHAKGADAPSPRPRNPSARNLWPGDEDYARACIRGHVEPCTRRNCSGRESFNRPLAWSAFHGEVLHFLAPLP